METVFVGLGSNLGQRQDNIEQALLRIDKLPDTRVLKTSSLYRTQPVGRSDQPEFLNAAAELRTGLDPFELLGALQEIEDLLGRERAEPWGPRTIDLDILYYDAWILDQTGLVLPHPRLHERAFVLVPLAEIAPLWLDPVKNQTVQEMLDRLDLAGQQVVKYLVPEG